MYVYPNNSIYRGQMKKKDAFTDIRMSHSDANSTNDDQGINEYRHGYGIQYWTDGAHYEGQWFMNKAEGQGTFWHAGGTERGRGGEGCCGTGSLWRC